eukprot:CAMPEP_0206487440 /NCGR_PEP_ID=MMETSP0324_2-20121206/41643_1 /ASSEMBLY_ACC=CAM_ASM_000836 /TAXON_ID=2866 /ORGANISM="Crypthecodinium cohnii, Strain Seligo" /LENGTH=90 /DNA_ID=CAMNT_0053965923 /DNA_START=13 /DNA_END=286 /DNA_ORIENTATION=-
MAWARQAIERAETVLAKAEQRKPCNPTSCRGSEDTTDRQIDMPGALNGQTERAVRALHLGRSPVTQTDNKNTTPSTRCSSPMLQAHAALD